MTFALSGQDHLGALAPDGGVIDLTVRTQSPALASMQALIEAGEEGLRAAHRAASEATFTLDPADLDWRAPLPCPVQMRDFLVFEEHMRIAGWNGARLRERLGGPPAPKEPMPIPPIWYQQPIYYKCNRFAVSGPGAVVDWPPNSAIIDYELELACVIGKRGRDIPAAAADEHIFGYTIFNDLTARDLQFKEMQAPLGPAKGKDFDKANVLGPVIVTADELPDISRLGMRAFVNGELWSEGSAGTMAFSFEQMIEHVSCSETIHPGEIFGSGTVGKGCGLELGRFLRDGDVVALEIDGIGRIEATISAPHVAERVLL
jgi:2-keto-4-pentenoate hydratase/2-oxohepta-3-ene-1,7-dioic acid hydratase in catechol pathway